LDDYPLESLRYVDLHAVLPEDSPSELRASYDALLGPLLLNSSLAAIKAQKFTANALIAIGNTTRALNNLELSSADKGGSILCLCQVHVL
jgi:peptidyl-prolyl isomerase D